MRTVQSRSFLVTCCYCGTRRLRETMTMVPCPESTKRQQWIQILGEEFAENIKLYADPFVCMSHFKYLRSGKRKRTALPIPLPFCSEKNGVPVEFDEDQERFQLEAKLKREAEMQKRLLEKPPVPTHFQCCKCGEQVHKSLSVQIPKGIISLSKWIKKLGREFLVNARETGNERMCTVHLNEQKEEKPIPITSTIPLIRRKYEDLPSTSGIAKSMNKMCCYCGIPRNVSQMVVVPKKSEKWQKVLGKMFTDIVRVFETSHICLSHFEKVSKDGKIGRSTLPKPFPYLNVEAGMYIRDDMMEDEIEYPGPNNTPHHELEEEKVEPETVIKKEEEEDTMVQVKEEELDIVIKQEIEEEEPSFNEDVDVKFDIINFEYYDTVNVLKEAYPKLNYILKTQEYAEQLACTKKPRLTEPDIVCCYCKETRSVDQMVRTPNCPKELEQWKEELGDDFDVKDCLKESICVSHFKRIKSTGKRARYTLPIPLPFDSLKYDYPEDAVDVKMTIIPTRRCVYCGDIKVVTHLITVPSTGVQRKAWFERLGSNFMHNCRSLDSKICLDHFELQPDGTRAKNELPIPLPFRSSVQINTSLQ